MAAGPDSYDDRRERRDRRDAQEDKPQFKHFLPLPKPKHLVFIKPTVAVVADVASRSSVGVKMTANGRQLERYVVSRSLLWPLCYEAEHQSISHNRTLLF